MNKTRRFLSLLLTLVLTLSLCVIPAAAANTQARSDDPVVFVHGLMGWGQRDKINRIMPYWGMTTGSLTDYLSSQGYETYAASVGPISSDLSIVRSRNALSLCDRKSDFSTRSSA